MKNWMKDKKQMQLILTNDEGGTMIIKSKCSTEDILDKLFYWMDRGWYLDTEELMRRGY